MMSLSIASSNFRLLSGSSQQAVAALQPKGARLRSLPPSFRASRVPYEAAYEWHVSGELTVEVHLSPSCLRGREVLADEEISRKAA
ncbi:hypothetical protein MTO96_049188 [Rhipicephalus appendiculatus]